MNPFRFLPRMFFTVVLFIMVPAVIAFLLADDPAVDCGEIRDVGVGDPCAELDPELERMLEDSLRSLERMKDELGG